MRSFLVRHLTVVIAVGTMLAAVAVYLFFFVFGFHLIFIDDKVDEAGPVFSSGAGAAEQSPAGDDLIDDGIGTEEIVEPAPAVSSVEITTLVTGSFVGRDHPSSGMASVLTDGTDQRFLRFDDFETDNGPDLNVYLSTASADAPPGDFDDDFIDLGDLKGNIGSQNYEIPAGVDLDRYSTVVIWCVRFGAVFGAADLS